MANVCTKFSENRSKGSRVETGQGTDKRVSTRTGEQRDDPLSLHFFFRKATSLQTARVHYPVTAQFFFLLLPLRTPL